MAELKKRDVWSDRKVHDMLEIIKEHHILKLLESKTKRNKSIFDDVTNELSTKGSKKNAVQVREKFKALKLDFYKLKRNINRSRAKHQSEHFELLNEILCHHPAVNAKGVDTSVANDTFEVSEEDIIAKEIEALCENDGMNTAVEEMLAADAKTFDLENKMPLEENKELGSTGKSMKENKVATFKHTKKLSYQKAVKNFSIEWKKSQNEMTEYMKSQDDKFLGSQKEILQENRDKIEKILEKDREETKKMLNSSVEAMKITQPVIPFCCQTTQGISAPQSLSFTMPPFLPKHDAPN